MYVVEIKNIKTKVTRSVSTPYIRPILVAKEKQVGYEFEIDGELCYFKSRNKLVGTLSKVHTDTIVDEEVELRFYVPPSNKFDNTKYTIQMVVNGKTLEVFTSRLKGTFKKITFTYRNQPWTLNLIEGDWHKGNTHTGLLICDYDKNNYNAKVATVKFTKLQPTEAPFITFGKKVLSLFKTKVV